VNHQPYSDCQRQVKDDLKIRNLPWNSSPEVLPNVLSSPQILPNVPVFLPFFDRFETLVLSGETQKSTAESPFFQGLSTVLFSSSFLYVPLTTEFSTKLEIERGMTLEKCETP